MCNDLNSNTKSCLNYNFWNFERKERRWYDPIKIISRIDDIACVFIIILFGFHLRMEVLVSMDICQLILRKGESYLRFFFNF